MTGLPGMRGTGEFTTDFRPTNYRELYTFLEPNGDAPLAAVLAMLASEGTDDPKYNNFRDELPTRVFNADATGYASGVTTITLATAADAGWVNIGTLIVNSATGELMRATADGNTSTGDIVVTRNLGGTSLAVGANDTLFVAGHASEEGSTSPTSITFDPTVDYNYTQIFKKPFQITGTMKNTHFRTGDKEDEYTTKALKQHMEDMERAFFWSRRTETDGAAQKIRTTGGLVNTITTVEDRSGSANVFSEADFDRWLIETAFAWGSKTKVVFGGAKIAGNLLEYGKNRWSPQQVEGTYGISFMRYTTPAGDLLFNLHPQFRQMSFMEDRAIILDTDFMKYRYMENRDTNLDENIEGNDEDAVKHQFMTECGIELLQDKVHSQITDWSKTA